MGTKLIITNLIIIGSILGTALLSQHSFFSSNANNFEFPLLKTGSGYFSDFSINKTVDWLKSKVYPNISQEVKKREEMVKEEINQQKDKIAQSSWEATKIYLAEKILQTLRVQPQDLVPDCKP